MCVPVRVEQIFIFTSTRLTQLPELIFKILTYPVLKVFLKPALKSVQAAHSLI